MGALVTPIPLRSSDALGDEELVRRALGGERWGRELLYRRHVGWVLAMTARILSSSTEAEEIVQDAFLRAFAQLPNLREPAAFRGWLGQIAVSLAGHRMRRLRLMRRLGLDRGVDDATLEALADTSVAADQRAELAMIDRVLAKMKAPLRIAWLLRNAESLELTEVASMCGCSLATVKRRIAEADGILERHVAAAGGAS
jgi:RNA polymerase sigma-70 factor (ECF subfamily)